MIPRAVDANGNTLVHIAAANGQKKIFKELADFNKKKR